MINSRVANLMLIPENSAELFTEIRVTQLQRYFTIVGVWLRRRVLLVMLVVAIFLV